MSELPCSRAGKGTTGYHHSTTTSYSFLIKPTDGLKTQDRAATRRRPRRRVLAVARAWRPLWISNNLRSCSAAGTTGQIGHNGSNRPYEPDTNLRSGLSILPSPVTYSYNYGNWHSARFCSCPPLGVARRRHGLIRRRGGTLGARPLLVCRSVHTGPVTLSLCTVHCGGPNNWGLGSWMESLQLIPQLVQFTSRLALRVT